MGLLLWFGIFIGLLLLDRWLVVNGGNNRRRYQKRAKVRWEHRY